MAKKKNGEGAEAEGQSNPKREAVAKAMGELGKKADPSAMASYIKDHFNLDIENKVIGIHRHHILRAQRKQARASATGAAPKRRGRPPGSSAAGGDLSLSDVRVVKDLLSRHGVKRVQELIELLS
ncbi:MAG: hypothetical protein U0797_24535 [Gemmataceae bacterium]